jgi:four helix bundle protein
LTVGHGLHAGQSAAFSGADLDRSFIARRRRIDMSGHSSFRDLEAWQISMTLAEKAYSVSASLPASERFELGSQIRRAAISIPSNVAEGQRRSVPVFRHHLGISLGSLAELETQFELAQRLQLAEPSRDAWEYVSRCQQVLYGLVRSLRSTAAER